MIQYYKFKLFVVMLFVAVSAVPHSNSFAGEEYVLVRAPQSSPVKTFRDWKPFVDYLSKETGEKIILRLYKNRDDFENDLLSGNMDFVYLNPFYYSVAHKKHGFIPLLRSDAKKLQGILVVRKDSGINSVKKLKNKRVVFPSPNAFAASLVMRAMIKEKENIDLHAKYVGTHDNVYRFVVSNKASAGGGVKRTLNNEPSGLSEQLKIIYKTDALTSHPLAAHPNVSSTIQTKIYKAVIKLNESEAGRKMLKAIKILKPVRADHDRDYKYLERLNISKYATLQ